jgi:methylglutaconyl-CoA hydratase
MDPQSLFGRARRSPKVWVGRIDGHCVAGGMGLAAGLDITVASSRARFGFTEVRIGVAPAMISVVCLPKMRFADAQAAFLRGQRFDAAEAARMGLITYAVADEELDVTVNEVVEDLLKGGPQALAATKEILRTVPGRNSDEAFADMAASRPASSPLTRPGPASSAFREKRPAPWVPSAP